MKKMILTTLFVSFLASAGSQAASFEWSSHPYDDTDRFVTLDRDGKFSVSLTSGYTINEMKDDIKSLNEKISKFESDDKRNYDNKISSLSSRLDKLESDQRELDSKLGKIDSLEREISALNSKISSLESKIK